MNRSIIFSHHVMHSQDRFDNRLSFFLIFDTVLVSIVGMLYSKFPSAKHILITIICLGAFLTVLRGDLPLWALSPTIPGWNLIFDDEFNGISLDTSKWNIENMASGGYQNCCLGYGVQYFTPQALSFLNGSLRITTNKQNIGSHAYTSGAITTENKFSFLYGRVDIRAKLPKTQGFWPALWLLPNGSSGIAPFEIDMMELLGNNPTIIYMTNHWKDRQTGKHYIGSDFSQNYHIFSIIWNHQTITWYIDGVQRFQTSQGVSNKNMYIIINSSLGGGWPGNPNATTVFPQHLDIDYVRVYQPISGNAAQVSSLYNSLA